mgnify:CR=1 FL=1
MARVGIVGVLDGVAENTDDADNLASLPHTVWNVAGVTDQLLASGHLQKHQKALSLSNHPPLGGCGDGVTARAGSSSR